MTTQPGARPDRVTVLYFAGSGRSGSTLINNILGQVPGAFAAGEMRYLWRRGVVDDRRCGCGAPFSQCELWGGVMHDAFPDGPPDAGAVADRLLSRLRILRVPAMLWRRSTGRPPVPPHPDDTAIASVYQSLARRSGATVLLDSSKLPPYGLLLSQMDNIDLYVLHVVRDSRATAFSWRRKKALLDFADDQLMPRQQVWKSSFLWLLWNTLTVLLWGRRSGRYLRVRYEEFVSQPQETLSAVLQMVGLDPDGLPFESPTTVRLQPTHSVAGNPGRLRTGATTVRLDDEWSRGMPTSDRLVVTAMTAPALLAFGYRSQWRRG